MTGVRHRRLPALVHVAAAAAVALEALRASADTLPRRGRAGGGSLAHQLASLDSRAVVNLFEAMLLFEEEPRRLERLRRRLRINCSLGAEHAEDIAASAAETLPAWKEPEMTIIVIHGELRALSVFEIQLPQLLAASDFVCYVTWIGQIPDEHWLRDLASSNVAFSIMEISGGYALEAVDAVSTLSTAALQDLLARQGLQAIDHMIGELIHNRANVIVLKTRTDIFLPPPLLRHIFAADYGLERGDVGRPFLRRVWVSSFDAFIPFYLPDEVIAASLVDWHQLLWPPAALRPWPKTMGIAGFHVNRWLAPFLPWYPLLFMYRRNAYDITDKLPETMGSLARGWAPDSLGLRPKRQSSLVIELARLRRLPPPADDYLVRLLALWYRLVSAFFLIGHPGRRGGSYLLTRGNASARLVHDGVVRISGTRCIPGTFSFEPLDGDGVEISDNFVSRCALATDISGGLVQANVAARHWARPVFDVLWALRVITGPDVGEHALPPDGLTERVAAAAAAQMPAKHHASAEGVGLARLYGRYEEELQTRWCFDFMYPGNVEPAGMWAKCCGQGKWQAECFPSDVFDRCCFPSVTYCPVWLHIYWASVATDFITAFVLVSPAHLDWLTQHIERGFRSQTFMTKLSRLCHEDPGERARREASLCPPVTPAREVAEAEGEDAVDMLAACELRAIAKKQLGALAPEVAADGAGVGRKLWASVDGRGMYRRFIF